MHVIVGCGNLYRKDDGIGVVVAQRLQSYFSKHPQSDLQIVEAGTNGNDVSMVNTTAPVLQISAQTGEGLSAWYQGIPEHRLTVQAHKGL